MMMNKDAVVTARNSYIYVFKMCVILDKKLRVILQENAAVKFTVKYI